MILSLTQTSALMAILMCLSLALAWAWDSCIGEWRNSLHPVAWLGSALNVIGKLFLANKKTITPKMAFYLGGLMWTFFALILITLMVIIQKWLLYINGVNFYIASLLLALLIKPTFAWQMLTDEVNKVNKAENLVDAREKMSFLVSRDVSNLNQTQINESAISTLAENFNDSLVSPLLFLLVFGLPGAWLYRFANTADAMFGYKNHWLHFGKFSAIADDVLSYPGARISAFLLNNCSFKKWKTIIDEAEKTPSPNGGFPMSAMATALQVRLTKAGIYEIYPQGAPPQINDINRAILIAKKVAYVWLVFILLMFLVFYAIN